MTKCVYGTFSISMYVFYRNLGTNVSYSRDTTMPSTTSDVDVDVHRACASPSIVHYSLLLQITRQAKQYDA